MKNLLSRIFRVKADGKEIGKAPEINTEDKFDVYVHVLEAYKKDLDKGKFILLNGIKGIFRIENIYELGHSAQYRLELIRENLPKDYENSIERIDSYSTGYQNDSFKIMP
jgi:hypothetical protein